MATRKHFRVFYVSEFNPASIAISRGIDFKTKNEHMDVLAGNTESALKKVKALLKKQPRYNRYVGEYTYSKLEVVEICPNCKGEGHVGKATPYPKEKFRESIT